MKKIRRGNDFVFAWEIERNGLPENLSSVLEKHLYLSVLGKRVELVEGVDYDITGNVIRIEVTPAIANILGTYKAEFHYILPDIGLIDEDRKCAVDVDAFIIVNSTAQADDPSEFTVTSDMAIAFKGDKGDKGDSFTYADFTPEQIAELQQPATDAIASIQEVELAVETAEGLRVQAELNRQTNTSTAILNAEQATDDANNAAILANEKAGLAATATTEANTARDEANLAATAANTKAGEANTAAMAANTAAGLADTARTELTTAVNTKLGEANDKIEEMDTTLSTYDGRVTQVESDISQLAGDLNTHGVLGMEGINKLNPKNYLQDRYIASNGSVLGSASWKTSDYQNIYDVVSFRSITQTPQIIAYIAQYDSNKVFIPGSYQTNVSTINKINGAAFYRISTTVDLDRIMAVDGAIDGIEFYKYYLVVEKTKEGNDAVFKPNMEDNELKSLTLDENAKLRIWLLGECFTIDSNATYNPDGSLKSSNIIYPDLKTGSITINRNFSGAAISITASYNGKNATYTINRDSENKVINTSITIS